MPALHAFLRCLLIATCLQLVPENRLPADLIGYYPFDIDAGDASGSNNHGTPEGDAVASGPFTGFDGIGGAFQFSGAGHVVIPIDSNPDVFPQLTVTMWVQPDAAIVAAPGLYKTFGHDDGGWDRTFGLDNRNGEYRYATFTGSAPGPTATTGTEIVDAWTFLAAVWDADANEVRFHANENFVTEGLTNTPSAHTTSAIGNLRPDNFSEGWQGLIDDVRVFDEALSVSEIEDIFLFSGSTTANLTAILTEQQEAHATSGVPADAGGAATFTFDTLSNVLDWNIDFSNLSGPATGMHLHGPAGLGESAGVIIDVGGISGLNSPSSGSTTLTPAQGDELLAGQWYLNIHTAENGAGEIRGQVLRERLASWQDSVAGLWDTRSNWSSNPSPNHTVEIQPASSAVVIGPVADTTVRSIAIGTTSDGIAELRLQPGTVLTATELITIQNRGRLVGAGTVVAPLDVQDGGELAVLSGESFQVTGRPRPIGGTIKSLGDLSFDDRVVNSAAGTINASEGRLGFPGNGTKDDIGLTNNGTLNLSNIVVAGDVHSPSGSTINVGANVQFDGLVSGAADFPGSGIVTFNGGFDPGDSPARMSIGGGVVFGDQNMLRIEIGGLAAGTEFDLVDVNGDVTLGGLLQVELINDFEPSLGDSFTVMTFDARNDTLFREVVFPSTDWTLTYGADHLTLTVVPEPSGEWLAWLVPMLYWLRRWQPRSYKRAECPSPRRIRFAPRLIRTMNVLLVLGLIGGLLVTTAHADLIAFYPFDEDVEDSSGNGYDGMLEGDAQLAGPFTGRDGENGAAQFGGGGHVVIPLDINPSVYPQLSVTMWVKPDASIVNSPGLYKTFGHDDGGWDRTFGLDNREGEYRYAAFTGGARPGPTATTGTPITTDWTFLAAIWDTDEQTVTFYANENSVTEALINTPSGHTTAAIGNLRPDNFAEGWQGLIDDVFVFDHALTEEEVDGFRQPAGDLTITAALHQDQETHATVGVSPSAGGTATLTLDQGTNVLDWTVDWNDLSGPVTAMHFHGNAAVGENAGPLINIGDIGGLSSPSSGTIALSTEQADALRDGLWYVNIHTEANPPGEIRGQLLTLNTVDFVNPSGGTWENGANWTDGVTPDQGSSVSIRPANSMIALGPAADTTVRSLVIGATDDGVAELRLAGNSFFDALEGIRIADRGRLVANGTIIGPLTIDQGGELAVMSGESLVLTGTPRPNAGRISVLGDLTFQENLVNAATGSIRVVNGTLTVPGNGAVDEVGLTGGPLNLTNATIHGDVNTSADINLTDAATFHGLVGGSAEFPGAGTANFLGGYSPGDSPARISFAGDVVFGSENTLFMEIGGLEAGSDYDQLDVSGSVTLAGELRLELIEEFTPMSGNQFVLMTYDANNGTTFDNVLFPAGDWSINYGTNQLTISFGELLGDFNSDGAFDTQDIDALVEQIIAGGNPTEFDLTSDGLVNDEDITQWLATGASANGFSEPYLPGDTNLDGFVNAGDLNNLGISWLQSPNSWSGGDFNADGTVNAEDLNTLGLRWQESIPPAAAAVPEPGGGMLVVSCLLAACVLRRRFRHRPGVLTVDFNALERK